MAQAEEACFQYKTKRVCHTFNSARRDCHSHRENRTTGSVEKGSHPPNRHGEELVDCKWEQNHSLEQVQPMFCRGGAGMRAMLTIRPDAIVGAANGLGSSDSGEEVVRLVLFRETRRT